MRILRLALPVARLHSRTCVVVPVLVLELGAWFVCWVMRHRLCQGPRLPLQGADIGAAGGVGGGAADTGALVLVAVDADAADGNAEAGARRRGLRAHHAQACVHQ